MTPWEGSPRPPRDWQRRALPVLGEAWRAGERPVIRAVTGAGKAQLISEICAMMHRPTLDDVVVVAAPRVSLVEQLSGYLEPEPGSIRWRLGDRVGVYYGPRKVLDRPVIVVCMPSLPALVRDLAGRTCRALIVDECHRSETPEVIAAVSALAPRLVAGFSATPWRTDANESLSLFTREVFSYGLVDAIRDRVLVDWESYGDERGGNDADTVTEALIRQHGHVGPGIVSARSIEDATAYAARLVGAGVPALEIHSKLPRAEQRDRISRLRDGALRCLVHVSLLQEGVDLPWLRWLAMRRPTASAIRYFQELGRVLRVAPGKDRAVLLDPYNHEDAFGFGHASRIGDVERAIAAEAGTTTTPRDGVGTGEREPEVMPPTVAKSQVTRWARRSLLALVEAGLAEAPMRGSRWRTAWPSEAQLASLRKIGGAEARALLPHADALTRGEVSDVLGYLFALRQAQRRRLPLPPLPECPAEAVRALERQKPVVAAPNREDAA